MFECSRQRLLMMGHHQSSDYGSPGLPSPPESAMSSQRTPRRPVIKKPLNAFMLFMKEMRQKVIDECTLKESAAINQILGRKVLALTCTRLLRRCDFSLLIPGRRPFDTRVYTTSCLIRKCAKFCFALCLSNINRFQ